MDQEKNGVVIASLEYLSVQPAGGSELLFLSEILTSPFSGLLCLKSCLSITFSSHNIRITGFGVRVVFTFLFKFSYTS